jgi:broad specificity phosphatase PhoE
MPTLYLVRHAKPAASWSEATDPGLDAQGQSQAVACAQSLASRGPLTIYTSPLRRCLETSQPLAESWQTQATVLPTVAEIPGPPLALAERAQWLTAAMQGTWTQLQDSTPQGWPNYADWRAAMLRSLLAIEADSVIVTHYVAINAVVGAAQGHDRIISFRPAHASITVLQVQAGRLIVRHLGDETPASGMLLGNA